MVVQRHVGEVRAFNRFYTGVLGVLDEHLLASPYSLTEVRLMFELARCEQADLADLRTELAVDAGYTSRIVARLERERLVSRRRSADDGRRQVVALTAQGRELFAMLDRRASEQVAALLGPLSERDQQQLTAAMATIQRLLDSRSGRDPTLVIRPPSSGDLGWVVQAHGALYASEYGWDDTFEALVARIVADFVDHRDARSAAWIAELDGSPVGCVFCACKDDDTAQLRLLLVDPAARGHGVGSRLVDECIRFARRAGYGRMVLWTNDVLTAARRIYERAGFELVDEEPHHSFGVDLVGQTWSLEL